MILPQQYLKYLVLEPNQHLQKFTLHGRQVKLLRFHAVA
ncbi:unnamed protein product [Thelazia callipaeda]|uniref:FERM domain-containing protein n=1 Tax=Thelazia callipaeda TaxID=103827 RepID=A0A0N5CPS5_THECL|nr:unnamed protein product [Thelazia callipaeda]